LRKVENEKNEIQMERQKQNLEAKKLAKLQNQKANEVVGFTPR
jgi:hypothetical protein